MVQQKPVAILAGVFAVLLVLVTLDRAPSAGDTRGTVAVVPAKPSSVTRIVASAGSDEVTLETGPVGWTVRRGEMLWPADTRRLSAGLRLLTSALAVPADGGPVATASRSEISFLGGSVSIEIGGEGLSGSRPAAIDGRSVLIDTSVADLLLPDAIFTWADASALPRVDSSVTRLSLETPTGAFELARVGSRWGVVRPVRTPADVQAVAAFVGALASLQVVHLADAPAMGDAVLSLQAESPRMEWSLSIDASGRGECRLKHGDVELGTRMAMDAAMRSLLDVDPMTFVSPVVFDIPASDVVRLEIAEASSSEANVLERLGRSWSDDAELAEAVLEVVTVVRADQIASDPALPGAATVDVRRFGGLPLAELRVWASPGLLHVNDGHVTRVYSAESGAAAVVATSISGLSD